jgi:hypothetical protein
VRRVGEELALVVPRRLQARQHRVHRARQSSHLVVAARLANAMLQRGRRDVLHLLAHRLDGSQRSAGEKPGDERDGEHDKGMPNRSPDHSVRMLWRTSAKRAMATTKKLPPATATGPRRRPRRAPPIR